MNIDRELKSYGIVRNPCYSAKEMSNEEWQGYFAQLKEKIPRSTSMHMKIEHRTFINGAANNEFTYCGDTQWECYCRFINSVLSSIRRGDYDYCYHVYQIADLLRYEPCHLKAEWSAALGGCFMVSLDR